ncbi:hypothetical protein EV44_g6085 [Erysiphe necator]|uniref:Methyltransferase domain-containing protein n=1 Tax=Uncinula necator TaxID=52586 RepID=A0A0B1P843_UNCNE|nr:hypothetical protein EV44_g6085 [Erysiphe necator]
MAPSIPLPYSLKDFNTTNEYIESLLNFCSTSVLFQTLCGGVHILDFYTQEQSTFRSIIPHEWQEWLLSRDITELMDFLLRQDLLMKEGSKVDGGVAGEIVAEKTVAPPPPESLVNYIRQIRKLSLIRKIPLEQEQEQLQGQQGKQVKKNDTKQSGSLPRHITVGMVPKKIHEVENFAKYVVRLADDIAIHSGKEITHFIDFGSGQNYLGRALASPLYNKQIVAIENKGLNIKSAKNMDILANAAKREIVMRNKKLYRLQQLTSKKMKNLTFDEKMEKIEKLQNQNTSHIPVDLRPSRELDAIYTKQAGKGHIQYLHHEIVDGDLTNIIDQIEHPKIKLSSATPIDDQTLQSPEEQILEIDKFNSKPEDLNLMVVSIHSCGNLSHHGINSLLQNKKVRAIAIIGCCYNLLSERFTHSSLKHPLLRPNKCPINAFRLIDTNKSEDPHGFPMSQRVSTYNEKGIRLNITSRMMAVQAPYNWTEKESTTFFTRHFYRALFQRILLDKNIIQLTNNKIVGVLESTDAIIIGTLSKNCHQNFKTYVREAISKLSKNSSQNQKNQKNQIFWENFNLSITDLEIEKYLQKYQPLKKELSITWSLMAFSAILIESLIIVDRWLYLREYSNIVDQCWVEPVFDYHLSPRNMVVVGIKR